VKKAIGKFNPKEIYIGGMQEYGGTSVISGTLKPTAFHILAKSQKIPYTILKDNPVKIEMRSLIGGILRQIRFLRKQSLGDKCEILILANPKHLIMMSKLIRNLKKIFKVKILTYNVTLATKAKLDLLYPGYLEKEKIFTSNLQMELSKLQRVTHSYKKWSKFLTKKYLKEPIVVDFIRSKIKRIIYEESTLILKDYLLASKVMVGLRPKIFLTTTDPDTKILPFVDKANELGIQTVNLQHGVFFSTDPPILVPESRFFITWSKLSKLAISKNRYFKPVKILQWQSPFHSIPRRKQSLTKLKKLRLLLLTSYDMEDINYKNYFYEALLKSLSQIKQKLEIVIRTKSFQDLNDLSLVAAEKGLTVTADDKPDLHDSIRNVDVVIFEGTTAGLDSMLLGKPSIYFNPYTGEDLFGLSKYKAALPILSKKDLNKINSFLTNTSLWPEYSRRGHKFAKEYLGLQNKNNFDKIAKILRRIISSDKITVRCLK